MTGYLFLVTGPMFSGKTSYLINELTLKADCGLYNVAYVNSSKDQRQTKTSGLHLTSHSSTQRLVSPKIKTFQVDDLSQVPITDFQVIGVDEAQFFPDLLTVVDWVEAGKIVLVVGLDSSANRQLFGQIYQLIPHCDGLVRRKAFCHNCLRQGLCTEAPFSLLKVTSQIDSSSTMVDDNQILVGGEEKYEAACRSCYKTLTQLNGSD